MLELGRKLRENQAAAAGKTIPTDRPRHEIKYAGPQTVEAIRKVETALGVTLPASYRQFLLRHGAGGVVGADIAGILGEDPLAELSGQTYFETMRCRGEAALPLNAVVIRHDKQRLHTWCLDLSQLGDDGEANVRVVDYDGTMITVATSFESYLEQYLRYFMELRDYPAPDSV